MARSTSNPQTPNLAATHHPLYDQFQADWIKLGHVREGTGGFADGTYLIGHPREYVDHTKDTPVVPTKKLKTRRKLARYDNLAATILETKKAALFRQQPFRRVGATDPGASELDQWWEDVDGQGHSIDACMRSWWDLAATFGHVVLYLENPTDEGGTPTVCTYTPLDVLNWLTDENGVVTSVALAEVVPVTDLQDVGAETSRVRVVTDTGWTVYGVTRGKTLELQSTGTHNLGVLPVVYLFGKRRAIFPDIGQSILGDPRLHIDLFNLVSEERELLRNQTFSFINVPLGSGADAISVEQAKAMLGETIGTSNVMFSATAAGILSADAANVTSYQDEIQQLKRAIYRESGTPYESDSKDAEAQGSLELKREDLNVRLAAYADECEGAEEALIALWYRARYGADQWETRYEADAVTVHYPDKFTSENLEDLLKQVQAAQGIGMPPEVLKRLRIALLDKFEGLQNLNPDERQALEDAITTAADDVTPAEQARQDLKQTMQDAKMVPRGPRAAA